MTTNFEADFVKRKAQVKRYLALVSKADKETQSGGSKQFDIDRLHVLRAGAFLILYNLIEASARAAIQAIHDAMAAERVPFEDLSINIRREVVKGFKRNGDPDKHISMADVPVDFVTAALDVEYHFSGNVDARLIRSMSEIYGFLVNTNKDRTRNGSDLLTVKTHRNDLAHGDKTYDEVGRNFTTRDIIGISIRSTNYIEEVLKNISQYIEDKSYRHSPAQAEPLEIYNSGFFSTM